jgi:hypothetical protein
MKKLLLACAVSLLSGCAIIDAYLMTHYDPNEYKIITDIRADAQSFKSQCEDAVTSKANAVKLAHKTQLFSLYSEHIPRNELLILASKDLNTIAQGLSDQYAKSDRVSTGFCKIKFSSIETNADNMQKTIAKRPR